MHTPRSRKEQKDIFRRGEKVLILEQIIEVNSEIQHEDAGRQIDNIIGLVAEKTDETIRLLLSRRIQKDKKQ